MLRPAAALVASLVIAAPAAWAQQPVPPAVVESRMAARAAQPESPLATSIARAAREALASGAQGPAKAPRRKSCADRIVAGVAMGGVAGVGGAGLLLAASGGSDSAGAILSAGAVGGVVLGLLGGLIACDV